MKTIETQVWNDLKKGSISALESLYNFYVDKLFAYGYKISNDRELIQDEIHDLFLDLYRYREKLSDVVNIEAYLIVSLKRNLYKHNNYRFKSLEDEFNNIPNITVNTNLTVASHEEVIIEEENENAKVMRLSRIMDNLTNHQKRILRLRFNQEKSYEEISNELGLSVASARTLFYRTLKTIRKTALGILF
tara:strand:- start:11019 stop:11588 length:570 start_codon:yes stop_codon:yes gene_type:complete